MTKIKTNINCPFCSGTGMAEYFDMTRMPEVGEGTYTLGYLCENFGGEDLCPECYPNILN